MSRLRDLVLQAASSLWFVPLLITAFLGAAALATIALDGWLDAHASEAVDIGNRLPWFFVSGIDGARSMLATTAGALVTAGGVTLSGVLVALSIASGQYTSRVLRSFTGNRLHQAALGLILGSFVYSLTVLRSIGAGPNGPFVPELAVFCALPLTFLSVAALLAFAHGVARSIQASELLAATAQSTLQSARLYFDDEHSLIRPQASVATAAPPPERSGIAAPLSGYLRAVDRETLASIAEELDGLIVVEQRVGEFVVAGQCVASFDSASLETMPDSTAEQIIRCLRIGTFRTIEQDPAFGVRLLVDIALRALSPGINDTTTAEMAVHRLVEVLCIPAGMAARPSQVYRNGQLRLIAPRHDFESLLHLAHEQLLRAAHASPRVLAAVAEGWLDLRRAASAAPECQEALQALDDFVASVETWMSDAAKREPRLVDGARIDAALARLKL
jgi:uncharacterized membrane protein